MGKYENNKKNKKNTRKKSVRWLWIPVLLILAALLVLFVIPRVLYSISGEADLEEEEFYQEQMEDIGMEEEDTAGYELPDFVEFPVVLDEGRIEIESLFQFTGFNPDAGNQDATDVASIVLTNSSGQYLSEATVTATLENGTELTFAVYDMPAGSAAMAFSLDNVSLLETDVCTDITAEAVFEDISEPEGVEVAVDAMTVTVTNTSSEDLNKMVVYYRDIFDNKYFGGMTYSYNIEYLAAGESMVFTAEESLLGVIEVVHVAVDK